MSAFVVTNETINCVCTVFDPDGSKPCEQLDELGTRLLAMNAAAVYARYPDSQPPQDEPFKFRTCFTYTKSQQYKAVQCLRYQCSEGTIPETWALYKELDDHWNDLGHTLAQGRPEYDKIPWDMPDPVRPAAQVRLSTL